MATIEEVLESISQQEKEKNLKELVLFNDDVNTFDFVIETLMHICEHTPEQAEQCATIVHYNGKCTVKTGEATDLKPCCSSLLDAGLSAQII